LSVSMAVVSRRFTLPANSSCIFLSSSFCYLERNLRERVRVRDDDEDDGKEKESAGAAP
jgi:hypothetical protein